MIPHRNDFGVTTDKEFATARKDYISGKAKALLNNWNFTRVKCPSFVTGLIAELPLG